MFEVGFFEILVIAVLGLVVLGPEKLPRVARQLGRWMGKARSMARQFREQLEEEVDLSEMTKTKPSSSSSSSTSSTAGAAASAGAAGAAAGETSAGAETPSTSAYPGETYKPYFDSSSDPPPPEVAAAQAAAETAHSDNPHAPAPEPEADVYQPPAYANTEAGTSAANGTHESHPDEHSSGAQASTVESPPSYSDEEAPRKAGDYITTTHERSI